MPTTVTREQERWTEITSDPTTLAPEICIEVLSTSNTLDELEEKRAIYREAGTEEVWVLELNGRVHFYGDEEMNRSELVSDFPNQLPET